MAITRFTKLVGCTVPLQQAELGSLAPPEMAAAVSEVGGLGILGKALGGLTPATLSPMLEGTVPQLALL